MTFGEKVRQTRERMALSQTQLAKKLGVKPSTLNRLELHGSNPRLSTMEKVARALNVPTAWLLPEEQESNRVGI